MKLFLGRLYTQLPVFVFVFKKCFRKGVDSIGCSFRRQGRQNIKKHLEM